MLDAFWAISCLDGPDAGTARRDRVSSGSRRCRRRASARSSPTTASSARCGRSPRWRRRRASTRAGAPTVLIVGATGDPATPLAAGRAMQRVLGNARLLVVDGYRHTSFLGGNGCVDAAVDELPRRPRRFPRARRAAVEPSTSVACPQDLGVDRDVGRDAVGDVALAVPDLDEVQHARVGDVAADRDARPQRDPA